MSISEGRLVPSVVLVHFRFAVPRVAKGAVTICLCGSACATSFSASRSDVRCCSVRFTGGSAEGSEGSGRGCAVLSGPLSFSVSLAPVAESCDTHKIQTCVCVCMCVCVRVCVCVCVSHTHTRISHSLFSFPLFSHPSSFVRFFLNCSVASVSPPSPPLTLFTQQENARETRAAGAAAA